MNIKSQKRQDRRPKVHSDTKISHGYFWKMQYSVCWSEQIVWNHPNQFSIAFMEKPVSIYVVSNKVSEPTTATFGGRLYTAAFITKCSTGPATQAFGNTVINTVNPLAPELFF